MWGRVARWISGGFLGFDRVTQARQQSRTRPFGQGANQLILVRFPLTWSSHTFVNPFSSKHHHCFLKFNFHVLLNVNACTYVKFIVRHKKTFFLIAQPHLVMSFVILGTVVWTHCCQTASKIRLDFRWMFLFVFCTCILTQVPLTLNKFLECKYIIELEAICKMCERVLSGTRVQSVILDVIYYLTGWTSGLGEGAKFNLAVDDRSTVVYSFHIFCTSLFIMSTHIFCSYS